MAHDGYQQRFAGLLIILESQHVAGHAAVGSKAAPDLLAAGPCGLSDRSFASRYARIFLKLVGAIERRRVGGCGQAGADAETVDRGIRIHHPRKFVFVQPSTRKNYYILQVSLVQNAPDTPRQRDHVAAVETDPAHGNPCLLEARCQFDDFSGRRFRIVGIDQQHEIVGSRARKCKKGRAFIVMCLDEGVGHRSEDRNSEILSCKNRAVPANPAR